jgi:hypothetical protein
MFCSSSQTFPGLQQNNLLHILSGIASPNIFQLKHASMKKLIYLLLLPGSFIFTSARAPDNKGQANGQRQVSPNAARLFGKAADTELSLWQNEYLTVQTQKHQYNGQ